MWAKSRALSKVLEESIMIYALHYDHASEKCWMSVRNENPRWYEIRQKEAKDKKQKGNVDIILS